MQRLNVWKDELVAWFKTLASAAVYATLIVTFGFQVARVEGQSMAPTLADQDRLIVNKLAYRLGAPRRGDIVMLYYPLNPDKSFVKRVIAEEGDEVRIVDGRVYVNDVPMADDFVPPEYRSHDDFGPTRHSRRLLLRDGRPPEQQLRQPPLGHGAEEVHHRQGAAALVADSARSRVLTRRSGSESAMPTSQRCHLIWIGIDRYAEVTRVLYRVLFLNLAVAVAKIALGYVHRRGVDPLRRLPLADRLGVERRRRWSASRSPGGRRTPTIRTAIASTKRWRRSASWSSSSSCWSRC